MFTCVHASARACAHVLVHVQAHVHTRTMDCMHVCLLLTVLMICCSYFGHSRSATIVLAYLMNKLNISLDDALTLVMRTRPKIQYVDIAHISMIICQMVSLQRNIYLA